MEDLAANNRIGILGGTFNPVHMGHLILAQDAMEHFELGRILFMPCSRPPHKPDRDLLPAEHRIAMLEAAIEGDLRFQVSRMETDRDGISFTIDTARELHRLHPAAEITFILGADSLLELHLWKDVHELLALCRFVTFTRPGAEYASLQEADLHLPASSQERLKSCIRIGHTADISSTDIRYRVAEGLAIRYLVHPAVEMYIAEHSLYRR